MPVIIVDESMQREIESLTTPAELRDRKGRLLGLFKPRFQGRHVRNASDNCPYSNEELDAMWNETGGRSLAEIQRDWTSE